MKLTDIIFEELKTEEQPTKTSLNEGVLPLSPLLAFLSLKKKFFKEAKEKKNFIKIIKFTLCRLY